jgi:L-threonylcarbamoyladenylate synthase
MVKKAAGSVEVSSAVLGGLPKGAKAASPGMKYKHYAPRARVCIVKGEQSALAFAVKSMYDKEENLGRTPCIFCGRRDFSAYGSRRIKILGETMEEIARNFFDALRSADDEGVDSIYFGAVDKAGIGLAIMNRAIRAAGFDIVDASKEEEVEKHIARMHG